jgi:hypothetical protein
VWEVLRFFALFVAAVLAIVFAIYWVTGRPFPISF